MPCSNIKERNHIQACKQVRPGLSSSLFGTFGNPSSHESDAREYLKAVGEEIYSTLALPPTSEPELTMCNLYGKWSLCNQNPHIGCLSILKKHDQLNVQLKAQHVVYTDFESPAKVTKPLSPDPD